MSYRQLAWTPEKIARFWDWQSQYPETYFTFQFGDGVVACLRRYLKNAQSVLDYGCGGGFLIPHLAKVASSVVGADHSARSVAEATRLHGNLPGFGGAFLVDDLLATGRTFDTVLCVEVVEHLYDDELDQLLENLRALSVPAAYSIFTTPNSENIEKNLIYCPESDVVFHRWQHVRSWDEKSLPAYLRRRGFEIEEVFTTNMTRYCGRGLRRLARNFRNDLLGAPRTPHLVCVARAS
jgi:2-polyprenyl-3-methyl-5-hydroxy-6-metoxy-1,4-benzoquinol methylase